MSKGRILCQFKSDSGESLGAPIDLPLNVDKIGLEKIIYALKSTSVNFIFIQKKLILFKFEFKRRTRKK